MQRVEQRWATEIAGVEFAVESAPNNGDTGGLVALGRFVPSNSTRPPRVVLYRRPITARAIDDDDLRAMVYDVVVEQVAHYLGRHPEDIDPDFGR
jgi:predicted Zn-dependent protease with MMP-like domain